MFLQAPSEIYLGRGLLTFADIQLSGAISPKQYAFFQDTSLRCTAMFRAKVLRPIFNMQNKKNSECFFKKIF